MLVDPGTLNLDIVDYPGEWLLDLPLQSSLQTGLDLVLFIMVVMGLFEKNSTV